MNITIKIVDDKRYIDMGRYGVLEKHAQNIFRFITPRYIKNYNNPLDISTGFDSFYKENKFMIHTIKMDVLFKLVHDVFPVWNTKNRRKVKRGHTNKDWENKKIKFSNRCAYCGQQKKLTKDHIIPIIAGGGDEIGNIVPACMDCNRRKGKKSLEEFVTKCNSGIVTGELWN